MPTPTVNSFFWYDVMTTDTAAAAKFYADVVGWVPQDPEHGFVTHRAVDEVAATSRRLGADVDPEQLLEVLGLGDVAGSDPYRLSGGEQRRLALAAGLGHRPPLALA